MVKEKSKGLVAILCANTIFGLNIPVTKWLMDGWMSPMGYTTTRMALGAIIFWTIGSFLRREKVQLNDLLVILIGGLMGYLGTQFLFSQSLQYTSPVVFSLIMALTPVIVLLLSAIFLKEKIPSRKVIGIALSVSGAALIILLGTNTGAGGSNNLLGIIYAVLCVFGYSGYLVITRKVSMKYTPVTIAKWMFLVSAVFALPFGSGQMNDQRIFSNDTTVLAVSLLVFAILFSTTLAFFLMPYALKRLEASIVSVFMNVQPIVATVIALIVGQDVLTWDKPFAVLLVLTGVYLVTKQKTTNTMKEQKLKAA